MLLVVGVQDRGSGTPRIREMLLFFTVSIKWKEYLILDLEHNWTMTRFEFQKSQ